jgi:hypothetical protein
LPRPDVSAAAGTTFDALGLPQAVEVILQDGTKAELSVAWSEEDCSDTKGRYKVYGTFSDLPLDITNAKDFRPFVTVYMDGAAKKGLITS